MSTRTNCTPTVTSTLSTKPSRPPWKIGLFQVATEHGVDAVRERIASLRAIGDDWAARCIERELEQLAQRLG